MGDTVGSGGMSVDAVANGLASRQHGAVARSQLLAADVSSHAIDYRVKTGRFCVLHRGVYGLGPVPGRYQREMAAILACGGGAVLSHLSAASLWEIGALHGPAEPVHVSVTGSRRGPRTGVRIHRVGRLDTAEVTRRSGVPVTTPARTLLDLGRCVPPRELERAVALALRHRLCTPGALRRLLHRNRGRPGCRALRTLLDSAREPALTRSEAEAMFLDLVREWGLPHPHTNVVIEDLEVDFLWIEQRLVVEIDGYRYHSDRSAFERDRLRGATLTAAGLRVIRFTWRQLVGEPEAVRVRLTRALEAG